MINANKANQIANERNKMEEGIDTTMKKISKLVLSSSQSGEYCCNYELGYSNLGTFMFDKINKQLEICGYDVAYQTSGVAEESGSKIHITIKWDQLHD